MQWELKQKIDREKKQKEAIKKLEAELETRRVLKREIALAKARAQAEKNARIEQLAEKKRKSDENHSEAISKKRKKDEEVQKFDRKDATIGAMWERVLKE